MIHHVFANRSNAGDWLSARGIQRLLGRPVVEHLCDEPFVAGTLAALARLGPRDLVVIGGGGLFHAYFTPFWRGFAPLAARVPFAIWGVGHCDLKTRHTRASAELLRDVVGRARLAVVRDEVTRAHLAPLALPPPVPCPSLSVLEPQPTPGAGVLHSASSSAVGRDAYRAMRRAGKDLAAATGRIYRETSNRFEPGDEAALAATLRLYAMSDLVLSSRLHGCILAVGLGRPVLAVSGDFKLDSFMALAGLGEWLLDRRDLDRLPERLGRLPEAWLALDFVRRSRAKQRRIAARVLALADSL